MTGYVRTDTTNNIADGNVISAADLDNEFNAVQAGFNSSTGHTHDGTASEGAPITKLGPVQDVTISTTVLGVKTTNTVDLGTSSLKFKDFYLAGNASIGGTLGVTGTATFSGNTVLGDADTDTITQAASYVTGTQLKSAKTATNTLSLAAYDVDGTAYTNLITLTASNTPTLALTSTGVGTINNMSIGATTASTGAFTTITASTSITNSGLTAGRVTFASTAGLLADSANLTWNGSALAVTGTLSASDGTNGNIKAYVDGTSAYLQSLNQASNAYRPLLLMGSTVSLANNGVTNAILNTTGYFGVGTLTPSTFVHALGGAASSANVINWNARLSTADTGSSAFGAVGTGIYFDSYTNSSTQPIAGVSSYLQSGGSGGAATNFSGGITFWTKSGANASVTRAATIDHDGYFGLGVTTVGLPFDVAKTGVQVGSTTAYTIGRFREGVPNKGVTLGYDSGSQTGIVLSETTGAASNLAFWTYSGSAWGERARFDGAGNFGIGTSNAVGYVASSGSNVVLLSSTTQRANLILVKDDSGTASQGSQIVNFKNYGPVATGRSAGTNLGGLYFQASQPSSGALQDAAAIYAIAESQTGLSTSSSLVFYTNNYNSGNAEGMRLNSSNNLMVGTGPNNGQYYNIGVYKPSVPVALLINADNGYNTYINYSVYGGGISFGRDGSTGNFRWNSANDFGGTTWATLGTSGLSLSGSIYPAASSSFSISTNTWVANTFYEVIAPGTLSNQTYYWVTARWDHTGGAPYIMACAFMFAVVNTNGTGSDNTFTPLTSTHTGSAAALSFRSKAGANASTGLECAASQIVGGTLTINVYRFV